MVGRGMGLAFWWWPKLRLNRPADFVDLGQGAEAQGTQAVPDAKAKFIARAKDAGETGLD